MVLFMGFWVMSYGFWLVWSEEPFSCSGWFNDGSYTITQAQHSTMLLFSFFVALFDFGGLEVWVLG